MTLDRQKALEIARALLRARIAKGEGNVLENFAQIGTASGDQNYDTPAFEGITLSSALRPGVTTAGKAGSSSHRLIPIPRSDYFGDPAGFSYTDEYVDMAKARGVPADDRLALKEMHSALSRPDNLRNFRGKPLEVNGAYRTDNNPIREYAVKKPFQLIKYPATDAAIPRAVMPATQTVFDNTGPHQRLDNTKRDFNKPVGENPHQRDPDQTANTRPSDNPAAILRPVDVDTDKGDPHKESEMPEIRYKTSGEILWEFLGGIGKGIAQGVSDAAIDSAVARRALRGGVYLDIEKPDLFDPPTSPWDDTGRKIAPGIMTGTGPGPRPLFRGPKRKIGKIRVPKHLKPGTVPFGNYMHEEITKFLRAMYRNTQFGDNIKRGQRGVDLYYQSGGYPGFDYLDIKSDYPHSEKHLKRQIQNWGYEESKIQAITYDEEGNIYFGFGD